MINPELLALARARLDLQKQAFVPAGGGGMPPGDPAAAGGGMPPGGGGMPAGIDPSAMMAAMPPGGGNPAAAAGLPMDPATGQPMGPVTGAPVSMPGMPAADPNAAAAGGAKKPKVDPALLDNRMYIMQSQLTAIMNHLGLQLPPEAATVPPAGAPPLQFEQALPGAGGPADMASAGQAGAGAGAPAGGGAAKTAAAAVLRKLAAGLTMLDSFQAAQTRE